MIAGVFMLYFAKW